jgi:transposase InsO family protein
VPHANATLTERGRLKLAQCVVDDGWSLRRAAERFQVSHNTARRWATRYRQLGPSGMVDRPSRPHRCPRRTHVRLERKVLHLRRKRRLGPAAIAGRLGMHGSTVHRILRRHRQPKLATLDLATGEPIRRDPVRRYEWPHPGDLVHVDIKKLGRIPDGGGHRVVSRAQGIRNRWSTRDAGRGRGGDVNLGYGYIHSAVDDHSRLAYSEILPDEQAVSATAFWLRAQAFFAAHGITVHRVLTDNGSCYRSRIWRNALTAAGITHKRTRAYRPQTNGKVERYNRTLLVEWAYARPYPNEIARRRAFPHWLHTYNHHRPHTALGGSPPITRVLNLSGQDI